MRHVALALAALLLAAPLLAPTAAAAPVLDSGGGADGGWVAWRVQTDGRPIEIRVVGDGFAQTLAAALVVVDNAGRVVASASAAYDASFHGVSAGERVGSVSVRHEILRDQNGYARAEFVFTLAAPAGSWRALAYTAGGSQTWSYAIAGDGASVVGKSYGPRTLLLPMKDAQGGAAARADAFGGVVRADVQSTRAFTTNLGLYAVTLSAGLDFVSVRDAGGEVPCERPPGTANAPCAYARATGAAYTAQLTGAGAGIETRGEFYLLVADALLPA